MSRSRSAWCHGLVSWAPGYCSKGKGGQANIECEKSPIGYWQDVISATDCAFRCDSCAPCKVVSYSPVDSTCSWHWEQVCNISSLESIVDMGHCSADARSAVREASHERPVKQPEGRCVQLNRATELAPTLLPPKMVPQHLNPALLAPAASLANAHLRGKCFILLGDSTIGETATDLGLVLGTSLVSLERELRRLWGWDEHTSPSRAHLDGNGFWFHPSTRNMTIVSHKYDAVVYSRFAAHPAPTLVGNFMGIRSLLNSALQREINESTAHWCGARPRVLWLQAGYHDVAGNGALAGVSESAAAARHVWAADAKAVLRWLEALAPERTWLSRHVGSQVWVDPSKLERLVRNELLPARTRAQPLDPRPWSYSDHREAWACESAATVAHRRGADSDQFDGVALHLVHDDRGTKQDHGAALKQALAAAEKKVVDKTPPTQRYYLSMLRTLQALTHTYAVSSSLGHNTSRSR